MPYPNFEGKHLEASFFTPEDYVKWKGFLKIHKNLPKKYIFIYSPRALNYFRRRYKPKVMKLHRFLTIHKYGDLGVVYNSGIGAPHAVVVLEELIALGGKEFLNIGFAGGLKEFGVFLCKKAIRDEGTSLHYAPHSKFAYPDKELTERFARCLRENNIPFKSAVSWTIDAPYRETKTEIERYRKEGVATVEMESSALFVVGKVRKVKVASAFVASDLLCESGWIARFEDKDIVQQLLQVFDVGIKCLLGRKCRINIFL